MLKIINFIELYSFYYFRKSTRLETRIPGADANTYFSIAGSIASGLYGIRHKL